MPGFNVWGMGGFVAVPSPRVDSPGCSEASPPETASAQRRCGETRNHHPQTALRPLRQQSHHHDVIPSPPPLPHIAHHAVLLYPHCATVSRHVIIPVSIHVTCPYLGPADDVMLTSSRESAKSAYAPIFSLKTPKVTVFGHFHCKIAAALFCCSLPTAS